MRASTLLAALCLSLPFVTAQDVRTPPGWKQIRCDENLAFSFPEDHQLVDSGYAQFYTGGDFLATYSVIYWPDGNPGFINSLERLDHQYQEVLQGMVQGLPSGKLISSAAHSIGKVRAFRGLFSFEAPEGPMLFQTQLLLLKRKSYYISAYYPAAVDPDIERLFGSVELDPRLTTDAQMTTDIVSMASPYKWGLLLGKGIAALCFIGVVIFLAKWYTRPRPGGTGGGSV